MQADKILSAVGRAFIAAGILVFLFVGYQLWGTSISEARAQGRLQAQVNREFPTATTVAGQPPNQTVNTTPAPPPAPAGNAVAVLRIPKINLEKTIVEGTGDSDLKKAPGHYKNTPLPGQPGNAAIAGHRTTYGAPFGDLDSLEAGDEIDVTTKQGSFVYRVTEKNVVSPNNVGVLALERRRSSHSHYLSPEVQRGQAVDHQCGAWSARQHRRPRQQRHHRTAPTAPSRAKRTQLTRPR